MSDQFVAEIRIFAGNYAPNGWAFCNGQLLPISQNTALFSLIGTYYGGDGKTNFALPNLQGQAVMHPGDGPGLTSRTIGEQGGTSAETLIQTELPSHSHSMKYNKTISGDSNSPAGNLFAESVVPLTSEFSSSTPDTVIGSLNPAGGSQPHNNMQPYLGLSFIIALQGIFPPRS